MIAELGSFALVLGLVLSLAQAGFSIAGRVRGSAAMMGAGVFDGREPNAGHVRAGAPLFGLGVSQADDSAALGEIGRAHV